MQKHNFDNVFSLSILKPDQRRETKKQPWLLYFILSSPLRQSTTLLDKPGDIQGVNIDHFGFTLHIRILHSGLFAVTYTFMTKLLSLFLRSLSYLF